MIDLIGPRSGARGVGIVSAAAALPALLAAAVLAAAGCASRPGMRSARSPAGDGSLDLDPGRPVAEVDGVVITYGELLRAAEEELSPARAECRKRYYEIEQETLDALIDERLLQARAEAEGVTAEQLLEREVRAAAGEPSEEEIRGVYDDKNARYEGLLPSFEESRAEIREEIGKQREEEAGREFFDRLRAEAQIKFLFPPFVPAAVPVPADGPSRGDPGAPVTIVEFADFQCPFCARAQGTVKRILEVYGDRVRYVYRDFPLSFHRFAAKAAEAAHCAGDQDRYWEMHEVLFEKAGALQVEELKGYAAELGLDRDRFDACLDSSEKAPLVEESAALGRKLGVTGSPAFFINGRLITGAQPFSRFQEVIEAELAAGGN